MLGGSLTFARKNYSNTTNASTASKGCNLANQSSICTVLVVDFALLLRVVRAVSKPTSKPAVNARAFDVDGICDMLDTVPITFTLSIGAKDCLTTTIPA